MRFALILLVFASCTEHGNGGPTGDPADPPAECSSHCIIDKPAGGFSFDDCCDSVTYFFDPDTNDWQVNFCDPPPADPCAACTTDQICVQRYDGTCGLSTSCETKTVDCPDNACSAACEQAYCNAPLQCQNRIPCGTESPTAFTCYGP